MKIELVAQKENLTELLNSCQNYLTENSIKTENAIPILVAVEEIFINIASYAYKDKLGKVLITISCNNDGDMKTVKILFEDSGIPFNPLAYDESSVVKDNLNNLVAGGMGIFLVKNSMENLKYEFINGKNTFSFEKTVEVKNNG